MLEKDLSTAIINGLKYFDLEASQQQVDLWNRYINLLSKWNKAYNLTAVRNIDEMLDRHLIDSFSIIPWLVGERLIDVGTGPGLPGIPLAIFFPEKSFYLLDSNGKKTRFLQQVKLELGLENISVINDRVENVQLQPQCDAILSRAFTTLDDMLSKTEHLCQPKGQYFAMKGIWPVSELQQISKPYKVHALDWPNNDTQRHLVVIQQSA
ncbi:MAG: 16S rRNA (guanine(527)-N(7))-methyltransferase RsmG [Pseudomonadales bacterium]|nr:16S rRNA (guanine(527)-N(7))-methyltransferase RsmG [Pseudomonadales bacterium]